MRNAQAIADACPVCGSDASYDFTGSDFMFGTPGNYDYGCCNQCGVVYQVPMPDAEQIAAFYPDDYEQFQPERPKQLKNIEKGALRAVHGYAHLDVPRIYILAGQLLGRLKYRNTPPFRSGSQALDIGCGNGKFLIKLRALGWEVQGVEFNAGAVEVCRNSGLNVFHGDLHAAGFPDASFDMVSARHLIEHLPDPNSFMDEIVRILKPGGYLYIRTPSSRALGRKLFGKYWFPNEVPRHLVLFSPENLALLARRHGLKKGRVTMQTSPKFVLNSIDYVAGRQKETSKKSSLRRLLARILYVWPANLTGFGDEIVAMFYKQ
ncbi:MAG: class I SAM-dependent methyltransferase [Gammaproteobacteria bacterium]|nr:class I SAM-dependent methyltransferase [Gammaproteobacteria bacterium]